MQHSRIITIGILVGFFPFFACAEGGYIGENPGLNFYSTIDTGDYQITTKILTKRLAEKPTLDKFGAECPGKTWLKDAPTDTKILEDIANGNYQKLTEILIKNGVKDANTDTHHALTLCLTAKYQEAKSRARDEQDKIETLSSLGLYMDGDTTNSDYDIIADIEKINSIIFSKNIKYSGEKNTSAKSFHDFLLGKPVASLFGEDTPTTTPNTTNLNTDKNGDGIPDASQGGGVNLGKLIGGTCGTSTTSRDISDMVDDAFARELAVTLAGGATGTPTGDGYTRDVGGAPSSPSATNTGNTNEADFFHKMPCSSSDIFCIDITMKGESANLLGGGKNVSIEGLLDKHTEIMGNISETALRCEKMTNNFGSAPFAKLKLKTILAGARVDMANSPQISRRDKIDKTPDRENAELEDARRCAFAGAGLSTDMKKSNSILSVGYSLTSASTTENVQKTQKTLGPQSVENARYTSCLDANINAGRKSYYESFSTDLTEIQAYTMGMMNEIKAILDIGMLMNTKPDKCPE